MTIWVDFENAPHVWVLSSIIEDLRNQGYPIAMTARDFSYTLGLCQRFGYSVEAVSIPGKGKSILGKASRLVLRALRLATMMLPKRKTLNLALSHGSRSQILAARLLGIKIVSLDDYEHSDQTLVCFVDSLLVPFPISQDHWGRYAGKVVHYPGLKEELYLSKFVLGKSLPELSTGRVNVLFRPEGWATHYHTQRSEVLQRAILDFLCNQENILLTLLPRDQRQARELSDYCAGKGLSYWIPENVLDGPNLIWQMDLVIGGGGTMTREAAVLGVPAYSFFGGEWGAVDQYLQTSRRLVQIGQLEDIREITIRPRERSSQMRIPSDALKFVNQFILDAMRRAN
jgi:predicted glycosyltransferase